jgi:transposase-like protein
MNSDESATEIARRFHVNQATVKSWVYRQRTLEACSTSKIATFAGPEMNLMKKQTELSPEQMKIRVRELEQQLATEKMRSESLKKMIEIAERELKIDIRKKSGARQSTK